MAGFDIGWQCHDHKFDPVSQRDYYSLSAFFNSIDEDGRAGGGAKPFLSYKSEFAKAAVEENERVVASMKAVLDQVKVDAQEQFESELVQMIERAQPPYDPWRTVVPANLHSTEGTR